MADEKKILIEIDLDIARSAKSISDLKTLQKDLNAELKKTEIGTDAYKKFETELGLVDKKLKDVNTDIKLNQQAQTAQAGSLRDLQAQYNKYATALRETSPDNKVLGLSFQDAQKKAAGLKGEIADFESKLGNFTPNVGNYTNSIKDAATQSGILGQYTGQLATIQNTLKAGFGQAAIGANGLKTAMLAIPIFALIAGIALLISYFSKKQLIKLVESEGYKVILAKDSKYWSNIKIIARKNTNNPVRKNFDYYENYRFKILSWKFKKYFVYSLIKLVKKIKNINPND